MDTKRTLIWTITALAFVLGWTYLTNVVKKNWPDQPAPAVATTQPATAPSADTQPSTTQFASTQSTTLAGTNPTTTTTTAAVITTSPASAHLVVLPTTMPSVAQPATLGSSVEKDATYKMQLVLTPQGAGIEQVLLNQFKDPEDFQKANKDRRPYVFEEPYALVPDSVPLATRSVTVGSDSVDLSHAVWAQEGEATPDQVAFSVTLGRKGAGPNGADQPVLKIVKTFTLTRADSAQKGYQVRLDENFENLSDQALTVKSAFNGPTLPPREISRTGDRQVVGGYRNDKARTITVQPHMVEEYKKGKPEIDLSKGEKDAGPLAWAGASSAYFSAFVQPVGANDNAPGDFIAKVTALAYDIDNENLDAEERPVSMTFETTDLPLAAGQTVTRSSNLFFGPRWREVVDTPYYAQFPRDYDHTLVVRGGWCGYCTFEPLVKGMVILLTAFHWIAGGFLNHFIAGKDHGDWGIAIIMLVCVVRGILHPITKRSQVQMSQMSKMGPAMEKLKTKYADDKDELNRQMMQFYKQQGMTPILGCLPMFLQTPIWIALYSALQTTFELRQAPFLWGFTWIHDLAKPDYLIHFSHPLPVPILSWYFTSMKFDGINILPVLMAVVMFMNQKYQPKPMATTPEQQQQQKMMQWMTLLFPVFLYNGPSGLNLYILTSTAIGIMEAKVVRRHIKEREEQEKANAPVLVDTKPTRAARSKPKKNEPPPKKGGLSGWWAGFQEKVEQAKREQDRKKK